MADELVKRIEQKVQAALPGKRWKHTLGVRESAVALAKQYGADAYKAELAALLHDYAKYWSREELWAIMVKLPEAADMHDQDHQLWHAPVGAYLAEHEFGITDLDVLDAIRFHTSGRPGMSVLEKCICVADYIEPNRDYEGVVAIRNAAANSLEEALLIGMDLTIRLLMEKQKSIFLATIVSRNAILAEWKSGRTGHA
jgi:predicted HD superfamily hydrolase involved in NAD metabolism